MTHTPLRMCVACREHKPASELIRVTVSDGCAKPDGDIKNFARGAYVCRNRQCIEKAEKKHIIERHLKCKADASLYREAVELI